MALKWLDTGHFFGPAYNPTRLCLTRHPTRPDPTRPAGRMSSVSRVCCVLREVLYCLSVKRGLTCSKKIMSENAFVKLLNSSTDFDKIMHTYFMSLDRDLKLILDPNTLMTWVGLLNCLPFQKGSEAVLVDWWITVGGTKIRAISADIFN